MPEHMSPRSEKLVFNSVRNFRRVTHFWMCLLETQVDSSDSCCSNENCGSIGSSNITNSSGSNVSSGSINSSNIIGSTESSDSKKKYCQK